METAKKIAESAKAAAAKQAIALLDGNPDKNLPRLLAWADAFDKNDYFPSQREAFHRVLDNPDNNWYQLIKSLWTDIDDDVRKRLFENFVVNATLVGWGRQESARSAYGCNVPWAILIDPTSACNLRCTGCWAAEYGNRLNLSYEELDDVVRQANELGTYMFLFSGGEPLVRKADIIRLCEAHSDSVFLAFTNGTLIDEKFAEDMLRVKNFLPAISVEGFEEATDGRRGAGTFQAVMRAMDILRSHKLPFGASCCYTSANWDSISSEEFIDLLIDKGAKFAWFFHYMPVGNDAVVDLLPTPSQREAFCRRIRAYRETKPLFTIDFQNDGEYVGGCIAGGRNYLHINANGDIEPCAFIHYADSNIRNTRLIDAYRAPLFMAYHDGQPFNENMLRPCPMLENPTCLVEMVQRSGARSTDLESLESAAHLCGKCHAYADAWQPTADRMWSKFHGTDEVPTEVKDDE